MEKAAEIRSNKNSDFNASNWSFPDTTEFPSGMDGEQMHMAIGMLYQELIYDIYHRENKRTYSQVRSSGALCAPMPFVLYSDLYSHEQFIRGMVTSGFSGILWAPEVRDCVNGNDLLRRVETITFSAHALYNSWRIPAPPWKQVDIGKNLAGEEMEDAAYYTDICRKYHRLRMSLLPYLYSAFVQYNRSGIPPIRALVMDYEEDDNVHGIDNEYMFGDYILVAPMTLRDGICRDVYLPQGEWVDFFTGKKYAGGCDYSVQADYDEIPVFVKNNCVIPIAEPVESVGKDTVFRIHIHVFGNGENAFALYEDDFESFDYENGKQNQVLVFCDAQGNVRYERRGSEMIRYDILTDRSGYGKFDF